ncbi:hypothetical protein ETB97_004780 [Aspergillus alliaceus]|uniref:Uncharacterized protein n=1 Tax=Petromyces alliaceus TaxID=209559 RepID=A0A8H6A2E3_PETAA|nr:hypothetical protein ETB97_004780 [Aspergillus burnettii]
MPPKPEPPTHSAYIRGIPKIVLLGALLRKANVISNHAGSPPKIDMDQARSAYEMAEAHDTGLMVVCHRLLRINIRYNTVSSKDCDGYNGEGKCRQVVEKLRKKYPLAHGEVPY